MQSFEKYKTWVEVSEQAIDANLRVFQDIVSDNVKIIAVIKSNAYGHGLLEVAKIVSKQNIEYFAVDSLDEALKLKKAGFQQKVLILGYIPYERLLEAIKANFSFVFYSTEALSTIQELLKENEFIQQVNVHLKIETGTNRQGLKGDDLIDFVNKIKQIPKINIEGVYTHYANVEDTTDQTYADYQLRNFQKALEDLKEIGIDPEIKHTACSAAALVKPESRFTHIRLGVSLYGLWSSAETKATAENKYQDIVLSPALTWKTVIVQIKHVAKREFIGYGLTARVERDSKIAVLPIGYWDGYDRKMSNKGRVLINGQYCSIIGRICMNMCMVDVTDISNVAIRDEVVLLGKDNFGNMITAEDFAQDINTINYEVVTRINPQLPRIIV